MAKICFSYDHFFVAVLLSWLSIGQVFAESDLKFKVTNGSESGLFATEGDITYYVKEKLVQLDIPMGGVDANNPLFCFDFSGSTTASISVNSRSSELESGTRLLLNSLHLSDNVKLQFDVITSTLELQVPTSAPELACFLRPLNDEGGLDSFGRFGVKKSDTVSRSEEAKPPAPPLFADSFEAPVQRPNLVATFGAQSLDGNGQVQYDIKIENVGTTAASNVAMQQSIPLGLDVNVRSCQISGEDCVKYQKDVLRYEGFSLAAEAQMVISVTASRNSSWPTNATELPVYLAVAAVGSGAIGHDVDEAKLNPLSQ